METDGGHKIAMCFMIGEVLRAIQTRRNYIEKREVFFSFIILFS